jgi:hypothetical protein
MLITKTKLFVIISVYFDVREQLKRHFAMSPSSDTGENMESNGEYSVSLETSRKPVTQSGEEV